MKQSNSICKAPIIQRELNLFGYSIVDTVQALDFNSIMRLYDTNHDFNDYKGGTFWSIYSQNISYKKEMHCQLNALLKTFLDNCFEDYKCMINAFVVKTTGSNSYLHLHRDTTAMDETQYSPISLWLPLCDVDENNGTLFIVPKTHHFAPLYRATTIPSDHRAIEEICWRYATPIILKKGQAVIFDPRILHFSSPNLSNSNRVIVVSSLFPKEAHLETCYLNSDRNVIEIYNNEDDFMFNNPHFLVNNSLRPTTGKLIKEIPFQDNNLSPIDFEGWCKAERLTPSKFIPKSIIGSPIAEPNN